ncbi:MAG: iron-containing alcohol dehydrogenase [Planctomycetota bacterium]|nr:iron-containing alcohol dehydrogenase [Planctomycetota bacterium]
MSHWGVPIIAIPTTFGTGSEATRVSVLSDREQSADSGEIPTKKSIRHDCMLPQVAIVDPSLGISMPPRLTAACGMDALTQAIESYLSRHASDLSDGLALQAARLLGEGLPAAFINGSDLRSREQCAYGSLLAGMALHNARLGLVHGLAHPLGIRYGISHGEICAMLLPHVLRFNRDSIPQKYEILSALFGADVADFCENLNRRFGLPNVLSVKISESERAWIVKESLSSGSTQANPRNVGSEDIEKILNLS